MPGNQNPFRLAKSTETKVVRRVVPRGTQCYRSKTYKIPQNRGWHSPFFGSILMELMPGAERVKAYLCVMILALSRLEFGISLFSFPSQTMKSGGIPKRLRHCSAAPSLGANPQTRNHEIPRCARRGR